MAIYVHLAPLNLLPKAVISESYGFVLDAMYMQYVHPATCQESTTTSMSLFAMIAYTQKGMY